MPKTVGVVLIKFLKLIGSCIDKVCFVRGLLLNIRVIAFVVERIEVASVYDPLEGNTRQFQSGQLPLWSTSSRVATRDGSFDELFQS